MAWFLVFSEKFHASSTIGQFGAALSFTPLLWLSTVGAYQGSCLLYDSVPVSSSSWRDSPVISAQTGLLLVSTSCITIALLVTVYVIRTLWFHPMSEYPGPLLARLTNVYSAYHSWKGDLHVDMWRAHEKYGDHVRYGPNRLLFNTSSALNGIYGSKANVIKCKGYLAMMARTPNTITQRDKNLHSQQRRLLNNGFSDATLRSYKELADIYTRSFCHHLVSSTSDGALNGSFCVKGEWSPVRDMTAWCDYLTFDIMLDVIYGIRPNMMSSAQHRSLFKALEVSNKRVGVLIPLPEYKNSYLDWFLFKSAIIARYSFIGFIRNLMDQKACEGERKNPRPNVYDILLKAKDGEGLSQTEIASESTNLILAGYDTTSTALASSFFYLSRYPEAYKKAVSEVQSVFSSAADTSQQAKLNRCTYLRACIDEALRIAPPVPSSPFREVEPEGLTVDGKALPPGCDIGTGIYAIHHNPAYFPDPFTFAPERWIVDKNNPNSEQAVRIAKEAYNPFSKGPRACVGKNLATMELMSILATVLLVLDFKIADGPKGDVGGGAQGNEFGRHRPLEYQLYDHVMATKEGPFLQFRVREAKDAFWSWNSDV